MTAALEGGEWSAARPGRTLPPAKTQYPLYRRLGGSQGRSGRAENLVRTGIRSRTVQPVAQSLYRLSYPAHVYKFSEDIRSRAWVPLGLKWRQVMKSVKCKVMPGNKAVCWSVSVILPSVSVPEIGCGYGDREYLGSILVTAQKKKILFCKREGPFFGPAPSPLSGGYRGIHPAMKKRTELASEHLIWTYCRGQECVELYLHSTVRDV